MPVISEEAVSPNRQINNPDQHLANEAPALRPIQRSRGTEHLFRYRMGQQPSIASLDAHDSNERKDNNNNQEPSSGDENRIQRR